MKASSKLFSIIYYCLLVCFLCSCNNENTPKKQKIAGSAQGTTYTITYYGNTQISKAAIDSVLLDIDMSMSTWNKNSIISKFNRGEDSIKLDNHFIDNLTLSKLYNRITDGAFNPLVKPLLDYYGLGSEKQFTEKIDTQDVTEILKRLQLDSIVLLKKGKRLTIDNLMLLSDKSPTIKIMQNKLSLELDFNAIAQGHSVDVLSNYLLSSGVNSFLIELGGEMIAKNTHPNGKEWVIGIDKPSTDNQNRTIQAKISLKNKAIATSGNYRKFIEINGTKFHHTIDPQTGFPAKNSLLSATVMASNCAEADALATAFMVMGLDKSKRFLATHSKTSIEAFFVYSDTIGNYKFYMTPNLEDVVEILPN